MAQTWTCIATCAECGVELNRATGVPAEAKIRVELTAPFAAICKERHHNTFKDLNLRAKLEWIVEAIA